MSTTPNRAGAPRLKRASSYLGSDIRGDTSAPAFATLQRRPSTSGKVAAANEKHLKPHSKRRKAKSILRKAKSLAIRRTWLVPFIIICAVLLGYAVKPNMNNPLHHALFLSHPVGRSEADGRMMYAKGRYDFAFVAFYTIFFSFTREFCMQEIIRPWAIKCGITKRAKQARFMEQVYTAMYFGVTGPLGLYVMSLTDMWYFNTANVFVGYPHAIKMGVFKAYYLLQASYWFQQAIVLLLQLEKPRKDFKELVLHHIVTLSLIAASYRFHFTHIGLLVYITHDVSDFFLATSKTFNYLDSPIVGPYFLLFILVWIYTRHYINLRIIWVVVHDWRTVGPYGINSAAEQFKGWQSQYTCFGLLTSLQAVNLFWLFLILRIAKNFVFNSVTQDERSEDEDEEEDEDPTKNMEPVRMTDSIPLVMINGEVAEQPPQVRKRVGNN